LSLLSEAGAPATASRRIPAQPKASRAVRAFDLPSPAKLNNMPPVPFRWPSGRELFKVAHSFPLRCNLLTKLPAGLRLAIKSLRHRSRPADIAEQQYFHFKIAADIANPQHVANPNLTRGLGHLLIGSNPAKFTSASRLGSRLKKPRSPKPLIDTYRSHWFMGAIESKIWKGFGVRF